MAATAVTSPQDQTIGAGSGVEEEVARAVAALTRHDPEIAGLALAQQRSEGEFVNLVAASSPPLSRVRAAAALRFGGVTAEGYPGARFHPGAAVVDVVEQLARERAQSLFGAGHANVQPHSASSANVAMLSGLLRPGERVLSLGLAAGGHLSHVAPPSSLARWIDATYYGVDAHGAVDADALRQLVRAERPRLIVCGGSACPQAIDYAMYRSVADEVDALLLADISHVGGLVATGRHPSPIGVADIVTTSTYKQLRGPRGGLVLRGPSGRVAAAAIDRAVFPGHQGTCDFGAIAGKAIALKYAAGRSFAAAMDRVLRHSGRFVAELLDRGVRLVGGGSDTHMVLVDLRQAAVDGRTVALALESAGVLVNHNLVPGDRRGPRETSGIRIGVNDLAFRRVADAQVGALAVALADVVAGFLTRASAAPSAMRALRSAAAEVASAGYEPDEFDEPVSGAPAPDRGPPDARDPQGGTR